MTDAPCVTLTLRFPFEGQPRIEVEDAAQVADRIAATLPDDWEALFRLAVLLWTQQQVEEGLLDPQTGRPLEKP